MAAIDDGPGAPARRPPVAHPATPGDAPDPTGAAASGMTSARRPWSGDDTERLLAGVLHGRPAARLATDLGRSVGDLLDEAVRVLAGSGISLPPSAAGQALDVLWAHLLTVPDPAPPASPPGPTPAPGRPPAAGSTPPAPSRPTRITTPTPPVCPAGSPVLVAGGVGVAAVLAAWLELTGIPLDEAQRAAFLEHADTRALGTVRRHRLLATGRELRRRYGALYLPDWRAACESYDVAAALPVLAAPGDPAWATAARRLLSATVDDVDDVAQRRVLRAVLGLSEGGPATSRQLALASDTRPEAVRRELRGGLAAICAAADDPATPAAHLRSHLRPPDVGSAAGTSGAPAPVIALAHRLAGPPGSRGAAGDARSAASSDPRRASLIAALARIAGYAPVSAQQLAGRALTPYTRPPNLGRGVKVR